MASTHETTHIITIDGPAGAGKSTVAKRVAQALSFSYLDTGAMYRALTLKAMRRGIAMDDESSLVTLAEATVIDLQPAEDGVRVLLDGEDVSEEIRTLAVTNNTFYVARAPKVRAIMVQWQRAVGSRHDIVVEGRDTGTVVFPHAKHKFYLDADIAERSRRRRDELQAKGKQVDAQELLSDLQTRDEKDLTRSVGPLKKADDAVFIDSTKLTIDAVVSTMLQYVRGNG